MAEARERIIRRHRAGNDGDDQRRECHKVVPPAPPDEETEQRREDREDDTLLKGHAPGASRGGIDRSILPLISLTPVPPSQPVTRVVTSDRAAINAAAARGFLPIDTARSLHSHIFEV
ncbi:MAG: hypothetical protein AcusKO_22030 [Acuticoccus sp.]